MRRLAQALSAAALCGLTVACEGGRQILDGRAAGAVAEEAWEQPIPRAECGPDDPEETGLQGQVPLVDRANGRSQEPYACNLERVGRFQGEGASWMHAWHEHCAYFNTAFDSRQENLGTVVIDASDPAKPQVTRYLTEFAMLDPWESLKVHQPRALLAGLENAGPGFAIYDVAGNCADPLLLASVDFSEVEGHSGNFTPDGLTYWGAAIVDEIYPIDISDPTAPELIARDLFPFGTHDLSASADGNRLYLARPGNVPGATDDPNGLAIFDVSEVQARQPDPEVRLISETYWTDGGLGQQTQPLTIDGHPYLLFVDELGPRGFGGDDEACEDGLPPYSYARLFDIADDTKPVLVARLWLEIHDPENCSRVVNDEDDSSPWVYDAHYCTPDDVNDAEILACGHFGSGFRVIDIRDPYRPKEIAYYIPPAQHGRNEELRGSQHANRVEQLTQDWATAELRLVKERGELWSTSQDNGFQVLRFTNGVWPFDE